MMDDCRLMIGGRNRISRKDTKRAEKERDEKGPAWNGLADAPPHARQRALAAWREVTVVPGGGLAGSHGLCDRVRLRPAEDKTFWRVFGPTFPGTKIGR